MGRKAAYTTMLIAGIAGVLDSAILPFYTSFNLGILLPGVAGLFLIIHGVDRLWLRRSIFSIRNTALRRTVKIIAAALISLFLAVEALLILHSTENSAGRGAHLLVLGAGLKGTEPSLTLKERLATAASIAKSKDDMIVIVSGGKGMQEDITEAEAMERYLLGAGIPAERILREERATSTKENIAFTLELLKARQGDAPRELDLVTSGFHALRAKLIASRLGLRVHLTSAATPKSVIINCYIRECFALAKTFLLDN